ncbi:hypothetical protein P3T76_016179 [Phytophthora citrophthora]|uniref:Uncharacterized protein n=1 Tax=Phytophthora citrophthora TaxID=4793 RepID=A0AAD9FY11_9STRA|nr:hypothetical protein P3T76_016179 [Phytophthora citrophthora]
MKHLEAVGVLQLLRPRDEYTSDGHNSPDLDANICGNEEDMQDQTTAFSIHNWGGAIHRFPKGIKLPSGTPEQSWAFWCCGDSAKNLPPFRMMRTSDLGSGNLRKRLSDLKFGQGRLLILSTFH